MHRTLALAILLSLTAGAAWGWPQGAVDRYLTSEMRRQNIPGISLAVVQNGKPLYVKSYGVATLEHGVRAQPQTVYQIGSIGKQFTATLVMMLVEEGKIGLDDPISQYFEKAPESWKGIAVLRVGRVNIKRCGECGDRRSRHFILSRFSFSDPLLQLRDIQTGYVSIYIDLIDSRW